MESEKMEKVESMPQVEMEQTDKNAMAERYAVYMRSIRKIKVRARVTAESRMKADRMGGAVI